MARQDSYTLNGTAIKRPSTFKIEKYIITNAKRLANGDMVADILSKKRKFYFTYNAITSDDLNTIINILFDSNTTYFITLGYVENGTTKTATVYPGSIPAELHRPEGTWVWKNVTFDLIEK